MSIKDLFRVKSNTVNDLQAKYRSIESRKKSLQSKADRLRAESLKSDIPDLPVQLDELKEEILLAEAALGETERDLQAKIEKKISDDYQGLNEEKLRYETRLNDLCRDAGKNTAKAIQSLQILNLSFANLLSKLIREKIVDFSEDRRFKGQMPEFLAAYGQAINADIDPVNFRDWKKRIVRVEQLQPGTPDAQRHVAARVKSLISA